MPPSGSKNICSEGLTPKNILITGPPRVGKTTAIMKIAERLGDQNPAGFYTKEIREKGQRTGFELESLEGRKALLSHVNIRSPHRVGKYKVDVEGFERFLDSLNFDSPGSRVIVIDEIGKMESLSGKFVSVVRSLLGSGRPVVATVGLRGAGFIEEIKKRPDVQIFVLSAENRQQVVEEVVEWVRGLMRHLP